MPMPPRRLDIIVPIYRNAALVEICVDSLLAHCAEIAAHRPRIFLINDSPDDPDVNRLVDRYGAAGLPDLHTLRNDVNQGFVRSVNRGLEHALADGHDALLVNSDTETFAGTLAELLRAASADPQIGFACPRSNNASICSLPHHFGGTPPTPELARQRWAAISRTMPGWHFVPTAVGFYLFIAHAVLANHGGLSEDFGVGYEEENDLVMRAGKTGYRAVMANHAFAYHAGSASFSMSDLDIGAQKQRNLQKLTGFHPEFLPLVRRYEASPHYRAEQLLAGLLKDGDGRLKLAVDLTGLGEHHNGTNELAVAVVRSLATRQQHRLRVSAIGSSKAFAFHGIDGLAGLRREEPGAPGLHAVAVRMGQPFDLHHVNQLEAMAPVNVYGMLDTIAEDCGPLAAGSSFAELWDHAAAHANGLFFISRFSEQTFCTRHPDASLLPRFARLLPTRLASYQKPAQSAELTHALILGNHFPHKGADTAAAALSRAFPTIQFVVLGSETFQRGNLTGYKSGALEPEHVDRLFAQASVVVLPSHVEGFGFGFMHALAAGRPIVARRIAATQEIVATLDDLRGVHLFNRDGDLTAAFKTALAEPASRASDRRAESWDEWADAFADYCLHLADDPRLFERLVRRIAAGDLLRRAQRGDTTSGQNTMPPAPLPGAAAESTSTTARALSLDELLGLDGRAFVEHAYATLLCRPVDASGLAFYAGEIESGVDKLDILAALASSTEGRARDVQLAGLDDRLRARRPARQPLLKRLLGQAR